MLLFEKSFHINTLFRRLFLLKCYYVVIFQFGVASTLQSDFKVIFPKRGFLARKSVLFRTTLSIISKIKSIFCCKTFNTFYSITKGMLSSNLKCMYWKYATYKPYIQSAESVTDWFQTYRSFPRKCLMSTVYC